MRLKSLLSFEFPRVRELSRCPFMAQRWNPLGQIHLYSPLEEKLEPEN